MTPEQTSAFQAIADTGLTFKVVIPGTPEVPEVVAVPAIPAVPEQDFDFAPTPVVEAPLVS